MYRNIPLMIALSATLASPIAYSADSVTAQSAVAKAREARQANKAHLSKVSDRKTDAVALKTAHREVVAMAPTEASIDGWRVRVRAAGPASEVTQDLAQMEPETPDSKLNVYGMALAAFGLGVMSIVRRMGRF